MAQNMSRRKMTQQKLEGMEISGHVFITADASIGLVARKVSVMLYPL
jgi:hypothetical protein